MNSNQNDFHKDADQRSIDVGILLHLRKLENLRTSLEFTVYMGCGRIIDGFRLLLGSQSSTWYYAFAYKCICLNKIKLISALILEINILWAAHQVHHSSEDYNLTTALRQSLMQGFGGC